jgi:hypothetical protein
VIEVVFSRRTRPTPAAAVGRWELATSPAIRVSLCNQPTDDVAADEPAPTDDHDLHDTACCCRCPGSLIRPRRASIVAAGPVPGPSRAGVRGSDATEALR